MSTWKEGDFLAGFLLLSLVCHGMFFEREWLVLGGIPVVYQLVKALSRYRAKQKQTSGHSPEKTAGSCLKTFLKQVREKALAGTGFDVRPEWIFALLIILSLAGLANPVRKMDGWLEILRWLVYFLIFHFSRRTARDEEASELLFQRLITIGIIFTVIGWFPGSAKIWIPPAAPEVGRYSSLFGYPNAAGVFLGTLFLLVQKDVSPNKWLLLLFGGTLLCTGSRAATALLLFFFLIIRIKKAFLISATNYLPENFRNEERGRMVFIRGVTLLALLLLANQAGLRYQASWLHILDWTDTSMQERLFYYLDSLKLAQYGHFLPQAGAWFAFPFVQEVPYWTLDPHSSFCRILLNQGAAGVLALGLWALKGIKNYVLFLVRGKDMKRICSMTAALYLGVHSLIDVDMSFGALGILFWTLIGLSLKPAAEKA